MPRKPHLFLIIIFVIFVSYFNSLENGFVFDDQMLILENTTIRSLKNIPIILGFSDKLVFRPIREITYAIDYFFYRYKPIGYHLSNLFFLFLTCCVVYFISFHFFQNQLLALFTSVIFAVHPIHTEAVTYISGRKDTLAGLFYFLGFYFFVKYRKTNKKKYFIATVFNYVLAIFSKEIGITLPIILFFYDFYNLSDSQKFQEPKNIWNCFWIIFKKYYGFYLSMLIFIALFCVYMLFVRSTSSINYMKSIDIYGEGNPLNIYTQIKIIGIYLKLLVFPISLNADYTFNAIPQSYSIFEPQVLHNLIIILFYIIVSVIFIKSEWKIVSFLLLSLLASMLPIMQIVKYPEIISERALFIPSLFFCLLLTFLVRNIAFVSIKRFLIVFVVITIIFSIRTISRNFDWKDSKRLWEITVKTSPRSARAHYNLGTIYAKNGRHKDAIAEFKKSLIINPEKLITIPDYTVSSLLNLGNVYYLKGKKKEAIKSYKRVLKIDPSHKSARGNINLVESKINAIK